jgi:hypothetical protein
LTQRNKATFIMVNSTPISMVKWLIFLISPLIEARPEIMKIFLLWFGEN